jgi:hypothetical protein
MSIYSSMVASLYGCSMHLQFVHVIYYDCSLLVLSPLSHTALNFHIKPLTVALGYWIPDDIAL